MNLVTQRKIGDLFKISKGKKSEEDSSSNLRYIQIDDLRNDNNIKLAKANSKNVTCTKRDVLIAWDGANAGTIGYDLEGVIGSTLAKLVPQCENFDSHYVGRFLQSKFRYLRDNCTGATIPHISKPSLVNLNIPLPPPEEQKKIVEILDVADSFRQKDQQLVEHYDRLSQSLFLDMFGVPNNNIHGFEVGTIRELVSTVNYGTSAKAQAEGEYSYLRMNNITYQGYMDFESLKYIDLSEKDKEKYLAKKGDILFNRTNSKELVGKTGLFDEDEEMALAGYLIRVRTNEKANPYYIWRFMNSVYCKTVLRHMCKSIVGMANINAQELQNIKVLVPPIELQNQFEKKAKEIEKQKKLVQLSLKKSDDLFNSLLQKAFKGELTDS